MLYTSLWWSINAVQCSFCVPGPICGLGVQTGTFIFHVFSMYFISLSIRFSCRAACAKNVAVVVHLLYMLLKVRFKVCFYEEHLAPAG